MSCFVNSFYLSFLDLTRMAIFLLSLVRGRVNRVILLLSSVSELKLFDVVRCCLSDYLNQIRRRRLSWKPGMISTTRFLNRVFTTNCSHGCLIVVGYWWMNVAECLNNVWSRGRYKVDWYWFLYLSICSSISLISLCFHGCWPWWRMVFLCSHCF